MAIPESVFNYHQKPNHSELKSRIVEFDHCLERARSKLPGDLDQLNSNEDLQDIISMNLFMATNIALELAASVILELGSDAVQSRSRSFQELYQLEAISGSLALKMQNFVILSDQLVTHRRSVNWEFVGSDMPQHIEDAQRFELAVKRFYGFV